MSRHAPPARYLSATFSGLLRTLSWNLSMIVCAISSPLEAWIAARQVAACLAILGCRALVGQSCPDPLPYGRVRVQQRDHDRRGIEVGEVRVCQPAERPHGGVRIVGEPKSDLVRAALEGTRDGVLRREHEQAHDQREEHQERERRNVTYTVCPRPAPRAR